MKRNDGTQDDSDKPGDKEKKPKGKSSFVPRWRQNQVEPVAAPQAEEQPKKQGKFQARWRQNTAEPAPEPQVQPASKKFQARWRQNTAEPPVAETPAAPVEEQETRLHPNLQQQPEAEQSTKGFQPRWRQRAQEMAAKEEVARAQAPPPEEKPGFQPRWRRTAAPSSDSEPLPSSEAPIEAQNPKTKGFQARWRERADREPAPAPAPKAEFTPRWKRTMAETPPPPVEAAPVESAPETPAEVEIEVDVEVVEAPTVLELVIVEPEVEIAPEPEVEVDYQVEPLPLPVSEAEALPEPEVLPEVVPEPEDPFEWTGAAAVSDELFDFSAAEPPSLSLEVEAPLELVAEAPLEIVAPPAQSEKRRLPRPQAPPPPKPVPEPPPTLAAAVPIPNTEDRQDQPAAELSVPAFLPGPEVLEARVEQARQERAPLVETEVMEPFPRKPKRLDEEALAALKATANMVTRGTPPSAPPPAPPPPPPPPPPVAAAPRYVPTPTPRASASSITVAGLKEPPPPPKSTSKKKRSLFFWRREKSMVGLDEVATFTRQFSVMIGAGLPIHQALSFFADSSVGPLAEIMDDVATKISSGHRLSQALSKHDAVFSEVYVGLIELGETSSHIDEALEKLADLLEKQVRLGKRLTSALVYPAFLVAVSLASIGVFLQYVLPTMIPLFASFNMELPLPTRMLLGSRHLVIPGAILAVLLVIFWQWFRPKLQRARRNKEAWAYKADRLTLKLPMLGKFFQQMATARVLFAMATMIETGLPILNALKRCETVASNLAFAERLEKAGVELRDGSTVTEALALYEVLPSSCLHLLSAGEESAQMAEMVQYAARFYEEEVEHSIDTFMSLVEPIIMIVMGVVVGFIVLSAVLPTVQMINHLGS